jgi:hypothetical protein
MTALVPNPGDAPLPTKVGATTGSMSSPLEVEPDGRIEGPRLTTPEAARLREKFFDLHRTELFHSLEKCAALAELHDRDGFEVLDKGPEYFGSPLQLSKRRLQQMVRAGRVWHRMRKQLDPVKAKELAAQLRERHVRALLPVARDCPERLLDAVQQCIQMGEDEAALAREKAERYGRSGPSRGRPVLRHFETVAAKLVGGERTTVRGPGGAKKAVSAQRSAEKAPPGGVDITITKPTVADVVNRLREIVADAQAIADAWPEGFLDRLWAVFNEAARVHVKGGRGLGETAP